MQTWEKYTVRLGGIGERTGGGGGEAAAPSRNFFSDKITLRTESLRSSYPTDLGRSTLLAG